MSCPKALRRETIDKQAGRCGLCGHKHWALSSSFQMHRIVPARQGGQYVRGNIYALCEECHRIAEGLSREQLILLEPYHSPPIGVGA